MPPPEISEDLASELSQRTGVEKQMELWFELYKPPSSSQVEMLEAVLSSWFMLGRLGGFNGMNLQVFLRGEADTSHMEYDSKDCETAMDAFFHDMTGIETKGTWARCMVNLGTSDELALDVIINAMSTLSRENLGVKQMIIGGVNEDWPVPRVEEGEDGRPFVHDPEDDS